MEEALLLFIFRLIAFIFRGIFLIFKKIFEVIRGAFRALARAQSGETEQDPSRLMTSRDVALEVKGKGRQDRVPRLTKALDDLSRGISAEARKCAGEEGNGSLGEALSQLDERTRTLQGDLRRGGDAVAPKVAREAASVEAIAQAIGAMTAQRRSPDIMLLLGDADALAAACYRPIVEYARSEGLSLAFERTAAVLGDSDLFTVLFDNPVRIAPVVLPTDWAVQVGWWPALIHEVGHCFYRSVATTRAGKKPRSLDAELRKRLGLPQGGAIPSGAAALNEGDVSSALGAWLEEIFADAFGVMMLGPAFILTMVWSFSGTKEAVTTIDAEDGRFEEHPPAHLRVVLGCRLLARMGYAMEARHLEAVWRQRHGQPQVFAVPSRSGRWIGLSENPLVIRAEVLVTALYEESFAAFGDEPLRSIPGLDFGPREHQAAIEVATALLARHSPGTRDPRILIAGAVQAWARDPSQGAMILRAARAHIPAVEASRRRLRLREEAADEEALAFYDQDDGDEAAMRDAIVLDAILRRPQMGRRRVRMG